jgi:hypothetical protein
MSFTDIESAGSSSLFSSTSPSMDFGGAPSSGVPGLGGEGGLSAQDAAELQHFIALEQEKAKMRAQVGTTVICP